MTHALTRAAAQEAAQDDRLAQAPGAGLGGLGLASGLTPELPLFDGAAGDIVARWRESGVSVDAWLCDHAGTTMRLTGQPGRMTLRAWSGRAMIARASIRRCALGEMLCPEGGSALACKGSHDPSPAMTAFEALLACSARCSCCQAPSFLRSLLLKF